MNLRERNQRALRETFEQTLKGRGAFERLDLHSTKAVVSMLDQAVSLARERPQAFFTGFPPAASETNDANAVGGEQQMSERKRSPVEQIENLLDFLKAQKEYWGERDDTGHESIGIRATARGSAQRPRSDLWDVIVELDPPPGPGDSVEAFDPRTGEKLGDMRSPQGMSRETYLGPEQGVSKGQSVQVRVNGVSVAIIRVGGP